ncbi:AAA family ATPase, partial [Pseudomonas putida]|nr:AAA family ATPase [Pseudomonas putida]
LVEASGGITGALIEQVCIDAKRVAVLNHESVVDEPQLFRRLGLALALVQGTVLSTSESEIIWLKTWAPKRFSLRALAKLYNMSNRNVTNILKEKSGSGQEKG